MDQRLSFEEQAKEARDAELVKVLESAVSNAIIAAFRYGWSEEYCIRNYILPVLRPYLTY